ncbi:unnamed protein product, partial [Rotaria sp. Silwood2]
DYEEFSSDLRDGKQTDSFYDMFSDVEADAKAFVIQACSKKSREFKALDLALFIDEKYYELTGIKKRNDDDLIRFERSCRLDLRRWGAKFETNSQRPYLEGHERDDVVKHRNEFINYFLAHKDFYYTITDGETPMWNIPTQNPPRLLIFHDESTFRSGEVSPKRCADSDVNYLSRQTTASINIGTDAYFDNDTILEQFERLFLMLEFKQDYKENQIEIIVDNARTRTTKAYSLKEFDKNIRTRFLLEQIEYVDENNATKIIDCYFKQGANKGKSKGLVEVCKDLGVQLPAKVKLDEIREILSKHRAFQNHCELTTIEGLWCNQKAFVRSRTDQSIAKMIKLIADSRIHFVERKIALKLFRPFWRSIELYFQGQTYADVLKSFFSQLCNTTVQSHRRISNKNINEP